VAVGWQALIVGLLAGSVGLTEIVTRYRSDPKYPLRRSLAAWLYIGLNAGAGVAALFLIRAFGWTFGQTEHVDLWRILVAGFGAIAFFRSSLFVTKVGDSNVGVGPSLVLGALLDAFDRDIDRKSAAEISKVVSADKLEGLNPQSVMSALPVLCLALMQNFAPGDQALLGTELIKTRNDETLTDQAKMRAVVVHLAKYLGAPLVESVLTNAREIFVAPPPPDASVATVAGAARPNAAEILEQARQLAQQGSAQQPSAPAAPSEPAESDEG
jgi:hypothetical protein